jgi:hypothetical protein
MCFCGATDCKLCGPAQGYKVIRVLDFRTGSYIYKNPEGDNEEDATSGLYALAAQWVIAPGSTKRGGQYDD